MRGGRVIQDLAERLAHEVMILASAFGVFAASVGYVVYGNAVDSLGFEDADFPGRLQV